MFASSASIADFAVVVAYTDASAGIDGMSMFIVERGTPGYEHVAKLDKQAIRTCETSILGLDACRVPIKNRLGDEGTGFRRVMAGLTQERMFNWARSVGIATASFEAALKYAKERLQFGKPIGAHQAIAFKLADMAVKLDAARLLGARACELHDAGSRLRSRPRWQSSTRARSAWNSHARRSKSTVVRRDERLPRGPLHAGLLGRDGRRRHVRDPAPNNRASTRSAVS